MSVPTEILGISKLFSSDSQFGSERYSRLVKTVQELKILDVAHVVRRGLEEDPAGSWSALKKATDDDFTAAKKFVEDLNIFLTSLERLIDSLDASTPKDGFNEKFVDFLSGKTADGLSAPATRNSSISSILSSNLDPELPRIDLISLLLNEIRDRSTGANDVGGSGSGAFRGDPRASRDLLGSIGQTYPYDYNNSGTSRSPKENIDFYADLRGVNPLTLCVYALSNTFNLSAGIARLKRIQSEVGLSASTLSDADRVFEGVLISQTFVSGMYTVAVTYQRRLGSVPLDSTTYALKVAMYDDGTNIIIPCEKPIDITRDTLYTSGETSLIRDSMAENDFNFQKLSLYNTQSESSLDQLQKITESLVGFMDTENELTPFAVLSKILESAAAALGLADQDDINKYQLLALMRLASATSSHQVIPLEKYLVQSIVRLKNARVISNAQSKAGSGSSKSTVTLETSRTSEGSGSVQADASLKTVETVSSTRDSSGEESRVIASAAISPPDGPYGQGTPSIKVISDAAMVVANSSSDVNYAATEEALGDSSRKEGTIFSLMLDLYDELTTKSKNRVGENETITDRDGYTNYGKMDEYAILSLIISCFSRIFASVLSRSTVSAGVVFDFGSPDALVRAQTSIKSSLAAGGRLDGLITSIDHHLYAVRNYVERYQNCYAFLDAYLKNIKESRLLAISNFSEVSKDLSFTSDVGRLKSLANATRHSIALRRALLRKWEPIEASGYLSRFSSTVSPIDYFINTLYSARLPNPGGAMQNLRVLHVGVPASTIVSDSVGETQLINVVVGKNDHRYYLSNTFFEGQSFIFDPALFAGDLGKNPELTTYYFFDRNGSSGPHSYYETLDRYLEANPGADRNVFESVILDCYNSAMIEVYQYYTSGIILDESTATGVDTSISPAGLSALGLLSGLNLPDVSLPPGAAISSAFSDGHINFEETASGLSSSKKEILSNVASSYLFKSNRILDRIARNFDHDRIFLIPFGPDSFPANVNEEFISTFGTEGVIVTDGTDRAAVATGVGSVTLPIQVPRDQSPAQNGMMAASFYAQISKYTASATEPTSDPDPGSPAGRDSVGTSTATSDTSTTPFTPTGEPAPGGIPTAPGGSWGTRPPELVGPGPRAVLDSDPSNDEEEDPRSSGSGPTVSASRRRARRPGAFDPGLQIEATVGSSEALKKFNPRSRF